MSSLPLKIVILGEGRVGKTSLLRRYAKGEFDEGEASSQNASYFDKNIKLNNGDPVKLTLWDTAGQERFHSLAPIYYRDADAALIVYDITDVESFRRVTRWVEELKKVGQECALALVGNKFDLRRNQTVATADAENYAKTIGAWHVHASAKIGQGVTDIFQRLAEEASAVKTGRSGQPQQQQGSKPGKRVLVADSFSGSSAANGSFNLGHAPPQANVSGQRLSQPGYPTDAAGGQRREKGCCKG